MTHFEAINFFLKIYTDWFGSEKFKFYFTISEKQYVAILVFKIAGDFLSCRLTLATSSFRDEEEFSKRAYFIRQDDKINQHSRWKQNENTLKKYLEPSERLRILF